MEAQTHLAAVAFTYAWWLTGEEDAAASAVRAAAGMLPAIAWDEPEHLGELLEAVRGVAAPARTMCPASELALLHDGHGLTLDRAAEVSRIPVADARTELAHGRLEALVETILEPFEHPERLGGLAVGNPPDVAHARTCTSCETVQELLRKGRAELEALPDVPPPVGLLEALGTPPPSEPASSPAHDVADRRVIDLTRIEGDPIDLPHTEVGAEPAERRLGGTALAVLAVVIGLVILGITALTGNAGAGDPSTSPVEPGGSGEIVDTTTPVLGTDEHDVVLGDPSQASDPTGQSDPTGPIDTTDATDATDPADPADATDATDPAPGDPLADGASADPFDAPEIDGFALTGARLVPDGDGPRIVDSLAPVRVAVDYTGADQVALQAVLDLSDGTSSDLRVVLTGDESSHIFVWAAPPGGWPSGPHAVRLVAEGALVGVVDVPVG